MLQSFHINGYRKFDTIKFNQLKQFNFFIGENNMGKTSLLESIYGWACGFNLTPFLQGPIARNQLIQTMRPYALAEGILSAVYTKNQVPLKFSFQGVDDGVKKTFTHQIIPSELFSALNPVLEEKISSRGNVHIAGSVEGTGTLLGNIAGQPANVLGFNNIVVADWKIMSEDGQERSYNISLPNNFLPAEKPCRMAKYIDILGHRDQGENIRIYAALKREGLLREFVKEMQQIFPEIDDIDTIPYPDSGQAPISIRLKNGVFLPLYTFGDGLQRWYHIIGSFVLYRGSMVCIDEVDVTFHPAAQTALCKNMLHFARKYDIQLFITTHNLEFLDAFLDTWEEMSDVVTDDICVITLKGSPKDGLLRSRTLSGEEAFRARSEYNMELR